MNGLKKQINNLLLFSILIGICIPNVTFAEEGEQKEKGKMEIKADRITKYKDQMNDLFKKTELEKRVPHLFEDSTYEKIEQKQDEYEKITNELKHSVLVEDLKEDSFIDDVRSELFTDDYEVALSSSDEEQKSKSEKISTSIVVASLILFGMLLCVGIYFFIQKWSTS